jgi:osmotically inducible protein OsmC
MISKAKAVWRGNGRSGNGELSTQSGVLATTPEAGVSLEPDGQGFRISRSALTLRASVPNLDQATFARIAKEAEQNCPVSKVLKADITLEASLV